MVRRELVKRTRDSLKGRGDEKNLLTSDGDRVVHVRISRAQIPRSMRLLDRLLQAAESRGMSVVFAERRSGSSSAQARTCALECRGLSVSILIQEDTERSAHVLSRSEAAEQARYAWTRIPDWDYQPSGRLRIDLAAGLGGGIGRARSRFADGVTQAVEDKLDEVLDEIERRAEHAEAVREETERLDTLYRLARSQAVEIARERHRHDQMAIDAGVQASRWAEAERLRSYARAVRDRARSASSREWLEWIHAHADRLDPLDAPAEGPDSVAVPEWDLRPYLTRWPSDRPWNWAPAAAE
jgi:hypothetical protein